MPIKLFYDRADGTTVQVPVAHLACDRAGRILSETRHIEGWRAEWIEAKFPGVKAMPWGEDGFGPLYAVARIKGGQYYPITRLVRYKDKPSRHVCDERCVNGSPNGICQCACDGANHGIGHIR